MRVRILEGLAGAREARGAVVVVDVLRAFTTLAVALDAGLADVVLVATPEEALARPYDFRFGEVGGAWIPGFDHDNSPSRLMGRPLRGHGVQRTGAGTACACAATGAEELWLASLVVADATARALAGRERVSIVASGWPDEGEEDTACAEILADLLHGRTPDREGAIARVLSSRAARKHAPGDPSRPIEDLAIATDIDRFGFAIRADGLVARRIVP